MTTEHNPAAWAVAVALAAESGLDWARWARGETKPRRRMDIYRRPEDRARPVPAPWDADAYRADCARRQVEPGPMPSLSWTGEDGFGWIVVAYHGAVMITFARYGVTVAAWASDCDDVEWYTEDDDRCSVNMSREVVGRIFAGATAAAKAMGR